MEIKKLSMSPLNPTEDSSLVTPFASTPQDPGCSGGCGSLCCSKLTLCCCILCWGGDDE